MAQHRAPGQPELSAVAAVTGGVLDWLTSFVVQPHPDLGRRGAVCPYLESALHTARVSLSPVQVTGPRAIGPLRTAARAGLARVTPANHAGAYEAALFLPYGAPDQVLTQVINEVQAELRSEALMAGRMIGIFTPGNAEPGIRSATFRPLDSPRPFLGVRTMVDTDLHFLSAPGPSARERAQAIRAWQAHFAARAPRTLVELGERRLADLETVTAAP